MRKFVSKLLVAAMTFQLMCSGSSVAFADTETESPVSEVKSMEETNAELAVESSMETELAVESSMETELAVESSMETELAVESSMETELAVESSMETELAVESSMETELAVESSVETEPTSVETERKNETIVENKSITESEEKTAEEAIEKSSYLDTPKLFGLRAKINGETGIYLETPVLTSAKATGSNVNVSWNEVTGAEKYRVYYKTAGSGWKRVGETTSTSYTVKNLTKGTTYTFTVRCITKDGKSFTSDYDHTGKRAFIYLETPVLTSAKATGSNVNVSWNEVTGAEKYRVYYKTAGSGWKRVGETTSTSYTVKNLTKGTTYTFTVRCITKDGKSFTSDYDHTGICLETSSQSAAYKYMKYLNDNYPDRVQNTKQVRQAGEWIKQTLTSFGYTVETYSYDAFGMRIVDYVATKKGKTNKTVYVGSHYDCVAGETRGADDNGSGVGVNLELAQHFATESTECTIKFCFWDAEELEYGCAGSYLFTERDMSKSDWNNALLCINLDCVGAGDELYVYGGEYVNGRLINDWGLNMADNIAAELGIELKHIPNVITSYKTPTRVASSDHYYFVTRGSVPYVYFEATAWTKADGSINQTNQGWVNSKLDGFADTNGQIMHTKNDNLSVFETVVPGRVQTHLSQVSEIVTTMLEKLNTSSKSCKLHTKTGGSQMRSAIH